MNSLSGRGDAAESTWGREAGWQGAEGRTRPVYDRVRVIRDHRDSLVRRKECPLDRALSPELHAQLDAIIARLDVLLARLDTGAEAIPPEVQDADQLRAWANHTSTADNQDGRSR